MNRIISTFSYPAAFSRLKQQVLAPGISNSARVRLLLVLIAGIMSAGYSYGQYCTPTYLNSCSSGDYVDGFQFSTISNQASGCSGLLTDNYTDYTVPTILTPILCTSVCPGSTYTATCTNNPYFGEFYAVCVDLNGDGDFTGPGEFFPVGYIAAGNKGSISITIPTGTPATNTRIRVFCSPDHPLFPTDICGVLNYGEAEDYCLVINPGTSVNIGPSITQCGGRDTLNAGNPGATYLWSDSSTSQTLIVSTSGNYSVTVTNGSSCSGSASVDVYIKNVPVVNLGPDIAQCAGSTRTLDAGNPSGSTYAWSTSETTQTIQINSTNTYSVTVTNTPTGCSAADTVSATFNNNPVLNLGPPVVQCGGTTTLNAGITGVSYLWSDGDTTQTTTVSSSGIYRVTVTNGTSCSATGSANVTINPRPFLGPDITDSICPFTTANLTNYYNVAGLGLTLNYGSVADPTAVGAGVYPIIATNGNGCSDTAIVTINLKHKPNLGADVTDSICPYTTADLTRYYNSTGLTMSYSIFDPYHAPAGTYTVIGTNASGCSDTATITINLRQKPNLGVDRTDSICTGYSYDLTTLYPNTGYATYTWNTATPTAVTAGVYTLIVSNSSGCTDTAVATIINKVQPNVVLPPYKDVCITATPFVLNTGTPAGGTYYVDHVLQTVFNPVAEGPGTHLITYVYTNTSGCTDSARQNITVHPQPFVTTLMAPATCTSTQPFNLDDYFTPTGGDYSGVGVSTHYFYPSLAIPGHDTIIDIYTDMFGCMDTSIYPIEIHRAVKTTMASSIASYSVCATHAVTFTASGAELYQFFVNGVPQGPPSTVDTFNTSNLNNHDVITVVGSNICSTDTSEPIYFDVHPLPVVDAGPDTSIAVGQKVVLQGSATSGTGLLLYSWQPTTGLNFPNVPDPTYTGQDTITFTLLVSDTYGCADSDHVTINVYVPDALELPNLITPNGDGYNDVWKINPRVDLTGAHLVIFNRWGELVYEADSYANDWGGTYKASGKPLPDGTYYFVFKVPSQHNHVYKGAINILNGKG